MSGVLAGFAVGVLTGGGWGFLAYRSLYRRTLVQERLGQGDVR